jgi:hypothetical protein
MRSGTGWGIGYRELALGATGCHCQTIAMSRPNARESFRHRDSSGGITIIATRGDRFQNSRKGSGADYYFGKCVPIQKSVKSFDGVRGRVISAVAAQNQPITLSNAIRQVAKFQIAGRTSS